MGMKKEIREAWNAIEAKDIYDNLTDDAEDGIEKIADALRRAYARGKEDALHKRRQAH
jgi:hypothetical protein